MSRPAPAPRSRGSFETARARPAGLGAAGLGAALLGAALLGAALLAAALLGGCSIEDAFVGTRDWTPCDDNLPVCRVRAGCVLDEGRYLDGQFPGGRRFVVVTGGEADVTVSLYFRDEAWPGSFIEVRWYEPGCGQGDTWFAELDDLFRAAGDDRVLGETRRVRLPGEHLVEVRSDAHATYDLKVDVQ